MESLGNLSFLLSKSGAGVSFDCLLFRRLPLPSTHPKRLDLIHLAYSRLVFFEKKTAATLCMKETGSLQFIFGPQALYIIETYSLQMFLAVLGWWRFGSIQTLQRLYLYKSLLKKFKILKNYKFINFNTSCVSIVFRWKLFFFTTSCHPFFIWQEISS